MQRAELEADVAGATVLLRGELHAGAEAVLDDAWQRAAAGGAAAGEVVLDFAGTEYISSTGIALIVGVLAKARAQGIRVTARALSDHYREIFEITRLADFMTIEGSR